MQLSSLIASSSALPSAPQAVLDLARTFEDEDARTADIVAVIESDPVLVLQLLRVANSPMFFRGRLIESPSEAVRLLGLSKVRSLVIGILAKDAFPALPEEVLNQYWRFSLNTAELSRHIAGLGRGDEDTAYIGGLLHMIGGLVMRVGMPERMAAVDAVTPLMAPERIATEVKTFGYSHAEVGAELARRWRLPSPIARIIDRQRSNNMTNVQDYDALVVQMASWRARSIELGWEGDALVQAFPANYAKALGVAAEDVLDWKPEGQGGDGGEQPDPQ